MSINFELLVQSGLSPLLNYCYHHYHARETRIVLKSIEDSKGPLPRQIVKYCDNYSRDAFGHHHSAGWLYMFCAVDVLPVNETGENWKPVLA